MGDLRKIFDELNKNCSYLILRNWNDVLEDKVYANTEEDIDILCESKQSFIDLTGATSIHTNSHRDNYTVNYKGTKYRFDIRWIGDGYYPKVWEKKMIANRQLNENDVYVLSQADYCHSLTYHALLQKPSLSDEYKKIIGKLYHIIDHNNHEYDENTIQKKLKEFLDYHSYKFSIPQDPAVFINWNRINIMGIRKDNDYRLLARRTFYKISLKLKLTK